MGFFAFQRTLQLGNDIGPTPTGRFFHDGQSVQLTTESGNLSALLSTTNSGNASIAVTTGLGNQTSSISFLDRSIRFSNTDIQSAINDTGPASHEVFESGSGLYADSFQVLSFRAFNTDFVALGNQSGTGLGLYKVTGSGALRAQGSSDLDTVSGLTHVNVGGTAFLIASSMQNSSITAFSVGSNGALNPISTIGADQYLPISAPNNISAVQSGENQFVLVAGSGSGSITVLGIDADGALTAIDQVNDDRNTRFQGIDQMHTFEVDGRAYVLAAGQDGGLSLLTVLPNGRLIHLETIADDLALPISNIADMEVTVDGTLVHLFTLGASEQGVGHFTLDLGSQGLAEINDGNGWATHDIDVLVARNGGDTLQARNAADILMDGDGNDLLFGGWGWDLFVLSGDGEDDTVADFQPGADQLDLSDWQLLYSVDQLEITTLDNGALIQFGTETLYVFSMRGNPIQNWEFDDNNITNATHVNVTFSETSWINTDQGSETGTEDPTTEPGWLAQLILDQSNNPDVGGSADVNVATTSAGDDHLTVESDGDQFFGGLGDDTINAGAHNATLSGGLGEDVFVFDVGNGAHESQIEDFRPNQDLLALRGVDGRFDAIDIRSFDVDGTTFTELTFGDQIVTLEDTADTDIGVTDFWFLE